MRGARPETSAAPYLRKQWYVAALAREVGRTPIERWLLDESLVLYRTEHGEVAVLHNRCPHRFLPLSRGRVVGDALQCAYHGFTYDSSGVCIEVPSQQKIPANACVRRYPSVERGPWIWVWMGAAAEADPALIPELPWFTDPSWKTLDGYLMLNAPYFLVIDNVLDLTHVTYVHPSSLGAPGVDTSKVTTEFTDKFTRITREMRRDKIPGFYEALTGPAEAIDRWQDVYYVPPSLLKIESRWINCGSPPSAMNSHWVFHFASPETPDRTRYYWAISRQYGVDDPRVDDLVHRSMVEIIPEDVAILEDCYRMMRSGAEPMIGPDCSPVGCRPPLSCAADSAALHGRRLLERMLLAESGRSPSTS